jgi:uncharacterized protein YndB with AHSA1/START domain
MWYMKRWEIDVRVTTSAPAATVYALLRDGASWPVWSPIGSFELRAEGAGEPEGVGAIRAFRTGLTTSVERIVELVPDRRLSYVLERGLPIAGYRADVDLTPAGDGTEIRWHSTFHATVPGTGWLYHGLLQRFITRCAEGLASHTEITKVAGR